MRRASRGGTEPSLPAHPPQRGRVPSRGRVAHDRGARRSRAARLHARARAVRAERRLSRAATLPRPQRGHVPRGVGAAHVHPGGPARGGALLRPPGRPDGELPGHRRRHVALLPGRLPRDRTGRRRDRAARARRRRHGGHPVLGGGGAGSAPPLLPRPAPAAGLVAVARHRVVAYAHRRARRQASACGSRSGALRGARRRIGGPAPGPGACDRGRIDRRGVGPPARASRARRRGGAGRRAAPDVRGGPRRRRARAAVRARRRGHPGGAARAADRRPRSSLTAPRPRGRGSRPAGLVARRGSLRGPLQRRSRTGGTTRPPSGAASARGGPRADRRGPAHAHGPLARLRRPGGRAAGHRGGRGAQRDRDHRPQRDIGRAGGAGAGGARRPHEGDRVRGGEDSRPGRGDRAVPRGEDRARHDARRDHRRDSRTGRARLRAASLRPHAFGARLRAHARCGRPGRCHRGVQRAGGVLRLQRGGRPVRRQVSDRGRRGVRQPRAARSRAVRIRMRDFDGPEEFMESLRDADLVHKRQRLLYVQALKFIQTKGGRTARVRHRRAARPRPGARTRPTPATGTGPARAGEASKE